MSGVGGASGPIEALYRDVILDHYREPRNRRPLERAQGEALVHNPVCGDQVKVEVRLEEGRIAEVSARSRGCSIAVAAGSVMSELVGGASREQAAALHADLERIVEGADAAPDLDRRLRAFGGVARFPSRRRCALLAWEALDQALAQAQQDT